MHTQIAKMSLQDIVNKAGSFRALFGSIEASGVAEKQVQDAFSEDGPFRAQGRVIRNGRTTVVAEAEIRDSKGVLCARGIGTWLVLLSIGS
jgi:acyl-coenzyme A thioesterase PaaI-like protein